MIPADTSFRSVSFFHGGALGSTAFVRFDVNDAVMNSVFAFVAGKNCNNLHVNWPLMFKFLPYCGMEKTDIKPGGKYNAAAIGFQ